ncbi:MAG: PqqD family protein [Acidobacteriota bacterium]
MTFSANIKFAGREDGGVLLNTDTGEMYGLDRVGSLICEAIAVGRSTAEATAAVQARYPDMARDELEKDVLEFIRQLDAWRLVAMPS